MYFCSGLIVTSNLPFDEWTGVFASERGRRQRNVSQFVDH
jgi:DNA replication protein DnaC